MRAEVKKHVIKQNTMKYENNAKIILDTGNKTTIKTKKNIILVFVTLNK